MACGDSHSAYQRRAAKEALAVRHRTFPSRRKYDNSPKHGSIPKKGSRIGRNWHQRRITSGETRTGSCLAAIEPVAHVSCLRAKQRKSDRLSRFRTAKGAKNEHPRDGKTGRLASVARRSHRQPDVPQCLRIAPRIAAVRRCGRGSDAHGIVRTREVEKHDQAVYASRGGRAREPGAPPHIAMPPYDSRRAAGYGGASRSSRIAAPR
jgi:hypothetical protein